MNIFKKQFSCPKQACKWIFKIVGYNIEKLVLCSIELFKLSLILS